jgi:small subunit ribosomal protein S13
MTLFLHENISDNKNIKVALAQVYGIGYKESIKICHKFGLNIKARFKDLDVGIQSNLANFIEFNYTHGFHLKRLKKQRIETLIKLRCYRGSRHFHGYLVRGQRSKNKKLRRHF